MKGKKCIKKSRIYKLTFYFCLKKKKKILIKRKKKIKREKKKNFYKYNMDNQFASELRNFE
jgi:hypothetical protein